MIVKPIIFNHSSIIKMEHFKERRKKSDKAKEKYERNGVHSAKHVRLIEKIVSLKKSQ